MKQRYFVVVHSHKEGLTVGIIAGRRKPTKLQAIRFLDLNFDEETDTLEITEEIPVLMS